MIVSKGSQVYNQTMRGFGLAPITFSPDSTSGGYPTTQKVTTTASTSAPPGVQTMSTAMQPIALAAPIYTVATPQPVAADPQSPAEVKKRGGVPANEDWTLPSDKPWATVFDPDYYYQQYRDLQGLVGQQYGSNSHWLLWDHFVHSGINEGRIAHPNWSIQQYLANYPDLMKAYNDPNWWNHNPTTVLNHWFSNGIKEGRSGAPLTTAGTPATTPSTPAESPDAAIFKCIAGGGTPVNGQCIPGAQDWGTNIERPVSIMITPELCAAQGQGYSTSDEYGNPNHPRCTGKQQPYVVPGAVPGAAAPSLPVIPILLVGAGALILFLKR